MNTAVRHLPPQLPALDRVPRVDQVGVEERVARFCTRSIKKDSKVQALKLALSMIDLTTLEGQDTEGKVTQLCQKAVHLHSALPDLPHVAAVCVYPTMVGVARKALRGHDDIKVASVATAFPSGMAPLSIKLEETRIAVEDGADEVDMVISRGAFLQGEYQRVFDASRDATAAEVRDFAELRRAEASPYAWRKYLASQRHFLRFCCNTTAHDLMRRAWMNGSLLGDRVANN